MEYCKQCSEGYYRDSDKNKCSLKRCACSSGGIPATGAACPTNQYDKCVGCPAGKYLDQNDACAINQCDCQNGVGTTGSNCPKNGDASCDTCLDGYYLSHDKCQLVPTTTTTTSTKVIRARCAGM